MRLGLLSTANINRQILVGARGAGQVDVVAVGSRDGAKAQTYAGEHGIAKAHGSYEALLEDTDVDAVYISLPNGMHHEWTMRALAAGKHVLCEKPYTRHPAEAVEAFDAAEAAGLVLMEAFMYRLHPSWQAVAELVTSGEIGRLVSVQSWFSYFNDDATNIRNIREVGGGALFDIGCYSVNLSRLLFDAEPRHVSAALVRDAATGVDVLTSAILAFDSGIATFTCSTRAEDDQRVHVYGTSGRISIGIPFNIPPDRPTEVYVSAGGDPPVAPATRVLTFEVADPYTVEAERFAAAVLDGRPAPVPPDDGVANLRVIERIFEAAEAASA